jgi:hypothetical protein
LVLSQTVMELGTPPTCMVVRVLSGAG